MTMPAWWGERRFGLFVQATAATVPAWAPIGEEASWYASHIGSDVAEVVVHPQPMVEALAHHRDRWGHIERYDDFVPLLTFDRFDAESWATLVRDAGARYAVHSVKHHDGWTWWDAPASARRMTDVGPRRNVVAEFAAACERNDIVFGASYSMLDWGDDRYPDEPFVDEALHPQVLDLVGRFAPSMLWGDGEWAHDAGHWKTAELMRAVRDIDPEIVIDDRWLASTSDVADDAPDIVATYELDVPPDIRRGPWELRRSIGLSFGHNRAERPEHQMTGVEIVDLLTEVVAKGGHLLLGVGPQADGTIAEMQGEPLRDAGTWIRRHHELLARAAPWTEWGDSQVRYFGRTDDAAGNSVAVVDIAGRRSFTAFDPSTWRVTSVEFVSDADRREVSWMQDDDGLHVIAAADLDGFADDLIGIAVFQVVLEPAEQPIELFPPVEPEPTPLAPLLADARPGAIIQLGDGRYYGPAEVPDGVTVRGFGPRRTIITTPDADDGDDGVDGTIIPPGPILTLGAGARVEHLAVVGSTTTSTSVTERFARPLVDLPAASASLLGLAIAGSITTSGDDVLIRAVTAQGLIATNADRLHVSRCNFAGNRWDVGVELRGGGGQNIDSNEFADHLCAVRATGTTGATIRGNAMTARWWGVHLEQSEGAHVHGNRIRDTMRAVDVDGGTQAVVDGNSVANGDSGCVVQDGASDCAVYGNHWDRCRIGLLVWGEIAVRHQDNACSSLHDEAAAHVTGP